MLSPAREKRLLQCVIAIACTVPIGGGLHGIIEGAPAGNATLDSHIRYLSGLLCAIGIGFLSTIPAIERHTARIGLLTLIVCFGGACRLLGFFLAGWPGHAMVAALCMELVVTPLICLWQGRLAKRFRQAESHDSLAVATRSH